MVSATRVFPEPEPPAMPIKMPFFFKFFVGFRLWQDRTLCLPSLLGYPQEVSYGFSGSKKCYESNKKFLVKASGSNSAIVVSFASPAELSMKILMLGA